MEKIGMEAILEMAKFNQGKKEYLSGTDQMVDKTEKSSGIFSKMGGALGGIAKVGIAAAVAGFGALTAVIIDSVGEAAKAQEVDAQLDAVLKATGGTAGMTKDSILALADSLSRVTPYEDDMIAATETVLLQFKHIGKDVFPQATEMALDLATRLGIDTTSAAKLLGKALEEPGEGLARLKQAGIAFTDEQEAMIKKMVESGDTAGAQKFIMDELEKSIGGAARAAGETFTGKMTILQNSIGNVKETIGAAFLPVLTQLADKFSSFVQENGPQLQAFFQGIADWTTTKLIPALLELWNWLQTNLPIAVQYLSNLWTTSLQPALAAVWSFVETSILPLFAEIYGWLFTNLPIAIQAFTQFWTETLAPALAVVWAWLKDSLIPALGEIWSWLATNIPPAIQTLSDFWTNTLQPALLAFWDFVQNSLIPAFLEIYTWLATNIPPAIQTLSDFWTGTLQPALQAVWEFISTNVIPIFQKVSGWFSGEGTESTMGWVDTIKNFLGPIIDFAYEQFSFIVDWVKENWPLIQETVRTVMENVKEKIDTVLTVVKKIVETVLGAIKDFWEEHGDKIMAIVKSVWDILKTVIDTTIKTIAGIIKAIMQAINGDWSGAWETIKKTLGIVWDGIKRIVNDAITIVKNELAIAWDIIKDAVVKAWDAIKDKLNTAWESIKKVVDDSITAVKTKLADTWEAIKTKVSETWDAIKETINKAVTFIKETVIGAITALIEKFEGIVTAVRTGVIDIFNRLMAKGGEIVANFAWVQGWIKAVSDAFWWIVDAIRDVINWLENLVRTIQELELPSWLTGGSPPPLAYWFEDIGEAVQSLADAALPDLQAKLNLGLGEMSIPRQSMIPAAAGAGQNVNVSFGDTTINSGLDASLFQAQVLQTVTRAVRGY